MFGLIAGDEDAMELRDFLEMYLELRSTIEYHEQLFKALVPSRFIGKVAFDSSPAACNLLNHVFANSCTWRCRAGSVSRPIEPEWLAWLFLSSYTSACKFSWVYQ